MNITNDPEKLVFFINNIQKLNNIVHNDKNINFNILNLIDFVTKKSSILFSFCLIIVYRNKIKKIYLLNRLNLFNII